MASSDLSDDLSDSAGEDEFFNYNKNNNNNTENNRIFKERNEWKITNETFNSKQTQTVFLTRPNASPGYWLCLLLPLALSVNYLNHNNESLAKCSPMSSTSITTGGSSSYKTLTLAAIGMCVESLCFFTYIHVNSWLIVKLLISLVPSLFTGILFKFIMHEGNWPLGILTGFALTFCYQNVYVRVLRGLPYCFSFGEASLLVQGVMLFVLNIVMLLPKYLLADDIVFQGDFAKLNIIMMSALFCLLLTCCLFAIVPPLRQCLLFYPVILLLLFAVTCMPVTKPLPIVTLVEFLFKDRNRINILMFYVMLVGMTVLTVRWQLRTVNSMKASTSVRKIFHALIVLVYIPGMFHQCAFLYIASGVALAIFSVLELFRILDIPPLGAPLRDAFASFSDEKDAGILALTPFSLLIGCSLPIWLHPCACTSSNSSYLALLAGILSIGVGDAAASVVGSKWGRLHWRDSQRSIEGSSAFVLSILLTVFILSTFGLLTMSLNKWLATLAASIVTALIEANTDQIDNLVLPSVFYIIISIA